MYYRETFCTHTHTWVCVHIMSRRAILNIFLPPRDRRLRNYFAAARLIAFVHYSCQVRYGALHPRKMNCTNAARAKLSTDKITRKLPHIVLQYLSQFVRKVISVAGARARDYDYARNKCDTLRAASQRNPPLDVVALLPSLSLFLTNQCRLSKLKSRTTSLICPRTDKKN